MYLLNVACDVSRLKKCNNIFKESNLLWTFETIFTTI